MQKLIRLLKMVQCDIKTAQEKNMKLWGEEPNEEIADEIQEAGYKLAAAHQNIASALDILGQIYEECYDD